MREFRDAAGVAWRVFRATPHTSPSKRDQFLPESYRNGWLVFECESERRRLAPVPEAWEELAEPELGQLCVLAAIVPVRRERRTTMRDVPEPVPESAPDEPGEKADVAEAAIRAAQMQDLLARVIDEVCDQPRAQSLDTGELIRVEETLSIAAHAAREAVALRRATHGNSR